MGTVNKIVIVGGGSAGWMSAATLIKNFPNKEIYVIESPDVPTVGVGESTIGQINEWLCDLDIKDDDWMKQCDASYKMSIKFTNFYKEDAGAFHYPFGLLQYEHKFFPYGVNDWYARKALNPDLPVTNFTDTFFPAMALVNKNKITENKNNEIPGWNFDRDVAYHFDAAKFGAWLRDSYSVPRGVIHIPAKVESIQTNDEGVEFLLLDNGKKVTADLFLDCTGFRSIILDKTLKVPFESYSNILPNNSAWATRIPYQDKEKELEPFTNCTAIGNGWVWNIPLWSRTGTGYVYSDEFISDEDALVEFKTYLEKEREVPIPKSVIDTLEFKSIKMRVGIHKEVYHKNVCGIGLAAGFIEPLESNGLYTVHEFLLKLVEILNRNSSVSQFDKSMFNEACRGDFRAFAEFVSLHYAMSHRDQTPYWQAVQKREFPKTMPLGIYSTFGIDSLIHNKFVSHMYDINMGGTLMIATGMNLFPIDNSLLKRTLFRNNNTEYLNYLRDVCWHKWDADLAQREALADSMPTLYSFLAEKYGNND